MEIECTRCNHTLALIDSINMLSCSVRCKCGARYHCVVSPTGQITVKNVSHFLTGCTLEEIDSIVKNPALTFSQRSHNLESLKKLAIQQRNLHNIAYSKVIHQAEVAIEKQMKLAGEQADSILSKQIDKSELRQQMKLAGLTDAQIDAVLK